MVEKKTMSYTVRRAKRQSIVKPVFYRCSFLFIISCTSADPNIFLGYKNSSLASFLIDTVNSLDEVHRWHRLNNGSDQLKVKGTFTARVKGRWSSASQL